MNDAIISRSRIQPNGYCSESNINSCPRRTAEDTVNVPIGVFAHETRTTSTIHITYNPLQSKDEAVDLGLGWGFSKNLISFDEKPRQYTATLQGVRYLLNQRPKMQIML